MIKTGIGRRDRSIGQQLNSPRAYKRSPALTNSTWYKGMLHSQMAGTADNKGAKVARPQRTLPVSTIANREIL